MLVVSVTNFNTMLFVYCNSFSSTEVWKMENFHNIVREIEIWRNNAGLYYRVLYHNFFNANLNMIVFL